MFDFTPALLSGERRKQIRSLKKKKCRLLRREFILEGQRLILAALEAGYPVRDFVVAESFLTAHRQSPFLTQIQSVADLYRVNDRVFSGLSDTTSPSGVLAVCPRPESSAPDFSQPALYLDQLRDPGNAGTLLRTAAWLGLKTIVASPGSPDLFQPKVVRGGMGAHFHLNIIENHLPRDFPDRVFLIGADQQGKPVTDLILPERKPWILAVGNEAHGLSEKIRERSDVLAAIPRRGAGESLNVAIAGALLLWALIRKTV
ncbi:MAG: TrmH family RNA methyltransferase [Fidelibacterota bacterium]